MLELGLKVLLSYLIGALNGALIVGKLAGGVDIRKLGSGNAGGTNALRTQGKWFAVRVMVIDVGKGFLPPLLLPALALPGVPLDPDVSRTWLTLACAGAAVVGHCYPVWFDFKGGKGAATAVGALLAIAPALTLPALVVWSLVLTTTGFVGLATMLAAAVLPVWVAADGLVRAAGSCSGSWSHSLCSFSSRTGTTSGACATGARTGSKGRCCGASGASATQGPGFAGGRALAFRRGPGGGTRCIPGRRLEAGAGAACSGSDGRGRPAAAAIDSERPLDLLSAAAIRACAGARYWPGSRSLDVLVVTTSTNEYLTSRPAPPPGRIWAAVAEYQTGGRGRRGRRWLSPLGHGVCLSVSWCFEMAPRDLPALSLVAGVAVAGRAPQTGRGRACSSSGPTTSWPVVARWAVFWSRLPASPAVHCGRSSASGSTCGRFQASRRHSWKRAAALPAVGARRAGPGASAWSAIRWLQRC